MNAEADAFALVGAALVVQACATSPASVLPHIADPEQLFAAADWTAGCRSGRERAGWADRSAARSRQHMNETGRLARKDEGWRCALAADMDDH